MSTGYVYGIDFGTTNSSIAVATPDGKVNTLGIDNEAEDPRVMRSVIYISPEGEFIFGKKGIDRYLIDVAQGKERKKKLIFTGKYVSVMKPTSPVSGYRGEELVPEIIQIEEGGEGRLLQSLKTALAIKHYSEFKIFGKSYSLEKLIGEYLKTVKVRAEKETQKEINKVVLGRPVHYIGNDDSLAVERMRKAAHYAGFKQIAFEYEQIGAAWDYALQENKQNRKVLIFDFGGGTLDLSVIEFPKRKILANVGVAIGGDKLDSDIFASELAKYFGSESKFGLSGLPMPIYIYESLKNWYLISLLKTESFLETINKFRIDCDNPKAIEALYSIVFNNLGFALYEEIDRVKRSLSEKESDIIKFKQKAIDIEHLLTRHKFEQIIQDELNIIDKSLDKVLKLSEIDVPDINCVVTTGGSSLIPIVRKMLEKKFYAATLQSQHTFTSVATGLALRGTEILS